MKEDGVDYLGPVGDRWGELCGAVDTANQWAEELMLTLSGERLPVAVEYGAQERVRAPLGRQQHTCL